MTIDNLKDRINKLEILFSEQEYTVESLNTVVASQSLYIDRLTVTVNLLKHQIKELKNQIPDQPIVDEKPPHY